MQNKMQPQQNTDWNARFLIVSALILAVLVEIWLWYIPINSTTMAWIVGTITTFKGICGLVILAATTWAIKWIYQSYNSLSEGRARIKQGLAKARMLNLQADKLQQELTLTPAVLEYGRQQGFNIDFGGAKVSSVIHNESFRFNGNPKDERLGEVPPETFTLSEALSDYEPSSRGILFGKSNSGMATLPLGDKMCHVASASKTGGGKTNLHRVIAAELLYLNQEVYFLDPTWQDIRINQSGDKFDYRPIKSKLSRLETEPQAISNVMRSLAEDSQKRMRAAASRAIRFPRKYAIVDEVPYIAARDKDFMKNLGIVIRIGRNYGIYLIVAAQDLQVATLGVDSGAFRDNFRTSFFGDGDMATARILLGLDKGESPDLYRVGADGVFLFNASGYSRVKIRVPLGDNEAVYQLLGRPDVPIDDVVVEDYQEVEDMEPLMPLETVSEHAYKTVTNTSEHDIVRAAIAELRSKGINPSREKLHDMTGIPYHRVMRIKDEVEAVDTSK